MQNPALWCKILQEGRKKKGKGFKCKEIQGMKNQTLTPFYSCLGLIKQHCFDWFGLVLRNDCKKENVWFSKEMLSKICINPCFYFGYKLSYNHPNEVIPIGKEP